MGLWRLRPVKQMKLSLLEVIMNAEQTTLTIAEIGRRLIEIQQNWDQNELVTRRSIGEKRCEELLSILAATDQQ